MNGPKLLTRVTLATSDAQHAALWAALQGTREGSTHVRIDKAALRALLDDHATLCAPFETRGLLDKKS